MQAALADPGLTNIPVNLQILMCSGTPLDKSRTLSEYGLPQAQPLVSRGEVEGQGS